MSSENQSIIVGILYKIIMRFFIGYAGICKEIFK